MRKVFRVHPAVVKEAFDRRLLWMSDKKDYIMFKRYTGELKALGINMDLVDTNPKTNSGFRFMEVMP